MAKRRVNNGGPSKSDAIREILAKDANTPVREIVSTLKQRGMTVHPNLVYLIKSKACVVFQGLCQGVGLLIEERIERLWLLDGTQ